MRQTIRLGLPLFAAIPVIAVAAETTAPTPYSLIQMAQGGANGIKANAAGYVDSATSSALKNWLSTDRGVTEVSATGITSNRPIWEVLLVRPLYESEDLIDNVFVQGSALRQADRTTVNLGLGYRKLVNDKKVLLGVNLFYDHEFPLNHQRTSIGGEIRTTVGEINANYYSGLSDWKVNNDRLLEKALGGYDVEVAVAMPYMPSAHLRAKTFKWHGVEGGQDITGNTYSITGALFAGLSIEAGYSNYNNLRDSHFVKLTYSIGENKAKSANNFRLLNVPYSLDSMVDRRFEKVRRENRIIKQVGKG